MIVADGVVYNERGEQISRFKPGEVDKVDDPRGLIESICHDQVNSILRIFSKGGSVRSNHYHKTDWHICYVVSGTMWYYERPAGSLDKPDWKRVEAGEWVRTGPMMEHTTIFPVDTTILVFAGNPRDQDSYESDMVRSHDLSALFFPRPFGDGSKAKSARK